MTHTKRRPVTKTAPRAKTVAGPPHRQLPAPPAREDSRSWLERATRRSPAWWIGKVQREITRASTPSDNPKHDTTDARRWIERVMEAVVGSLPAGFYDGNMRAAAVLSQVLALWYLRVHRAKCYDPTRPVASRQQGLEDWLGYATALGALALDERHDAAAFPHQDWESPFDPDATDGTFV